MLKKIKIDKELPKTYNPADYEDEIYAQWEKSGFFNPDNLEGEPYSIMMPPPNVTGVLHLGHALENSLMDIMARYQRMNGKKVLLVPGTDHAAVATQAKVEKILVAEGMKNPRQELGREKLLKKIREYAENSKATILSQIKKMGTSCDWSRLAYTFDEPRNKAVNQVFFKMYNDGLIYRGNRVVNWSVKGQSTLSDDELVHVERPAKLYTFKYSKDFPIAIASTRTETKLGDTAVAVNPKDKRYKKYIGRTFTADVGAAKPLRLKVIADQAVDMKFGTGAIGVTPAHSAADFEMYERQKAKREPIELIQVIGQDGRMTVTAGSDYSGLTIVQAREKFVAWLKKNELLIKEEDITQNVGTSDRFGDVVEAIPMTQWFVDVNKKIPGREASLKELIKQAIVKGHKNDAKQKIDITPERFAKVCLHWLDNLRDWCISRQIWWGHRIPVWYCGGKDKGRCLPACKEPIVSVETPRACPHCGSRDLRQDEDTLDTWFSSGMWTFSTLARRPEEIRPEDAKTKIWQLKIYGQDIFEAIASGAKKIETRAGRPRGEGKYWGDIKPGDLIEFSLADEKTDELVEGAASVKKQVKKVGHFKTIDELFKIYPASADYPGKSEKQIKQWWNKRPKLAERIKKYGIWALELEEVKPPTGGLTSNRLIIDSEDFTLFHPTSWMQMGYEIIFLWMVRMILMSIYALDQIPFKDVYIHGILRDETGRKFSKSSGNNVDPLEVIKQYGCDASRFSLVSGISPGNDSRFYAEKVEGARNLVNKIWNVSRFVITHCHSGRSEERATDRISIRFYRSAGAPLQNDKLTVADKWILGKLDRLIKQATDDLENYGFSQTGEKLRAFTWDDLADWYLEISKFETGKSEILYFVLENLLKLWHPFMPFVTEAIWKEMGKEKLLMAEEWPNKKTHPLIPSQEGKDFELVKNIIIAIRNARAVYKIEPNQKIKAVIYANDKLTLIKSQAELIKKLRTGIDELEIKKTGEKIKQAIYLTVNGVEIYLIIPGFNFKAERGRLTKEITAQEGKIKALKQRLANKEFISKAPEKIVKNEIDKLALNNGELKKLKEQIKSLK